jgi:hypothetical protein
LYKQLLSPITAAINNLHLNTKLNSRPHTQCLVKEDPVVEAERHLAQPSPPKDRHHNRLDQQPRLLIRQPKHTKQQPPQRLKRLKAQQGQVFSVRWLALLRRLFSPKE